MSIDSLTIWPQWVLGEAQAEPPPGSTAEVLEG
jgi:hypothetical protein